MRTPKFPAAPLRLTITAFSFAFIGALSQAQHWTPELTLQVSGVSDVRVSPDGLRAVFVVSRAHTEGEQSEYITQIHIANADGTDHFQLTAGPKSSRSPRWSPDGKTIAFLSSREESSNVWRISPDGGEAQPVTSEDGNISSFAWSPDGSRIAFLMADQKTEAEKQAEREKRDARVIGEGWKLTRLFVHDLVPGEMGRLLTKGNYTVGASFSGRPFDWSPDGRFIAFSHQPTPLADDWTRADISRVDVNSGKVTPLASTPAAEGSPIFSPDGSSIAFTVSDDPPTWGFVRSVHVMPARSGKAKKLAATFDEQPTIIGWAADGRQLFVSETYKTVNRITRLPVDGSPESAFSPLESMVGSATLNRTASHFGYVSQYFDRPPEAFMSGSKKFEPSQISKVQELPSAPLGKTEVIHWKSSDGRSIEGLLTYPVNYRQGREVPLLVVVHGGPTGVFTRSFISSRGAYPIAPFASNGYAILRCNPRGSSGYGREFRYANYQDWGGGDYQDIMSGVDHVVQMGVADEDRLGIMGWSYGGYMTSWVVTQTDRFNAASVGAGVTNLMSFSGTSDVPGFVPDYSGGEYWDVFKNWQEHSAMFQVQGVETPTLIQHGEQDIRVPVTQGYEFYNALKRQGVPVKMVVYPRQPHGIREPKLMLDAMHRNLDWFGKWIGSKSK